MGMQNIAALNEVNEIAETSHLYGESVSGDPARIKMSAFKDELKKGFSKRTVWDYATSANNNFSVPASFPGNLGDRVIITNGTGTGGAIWELYKIVTGYGLTQYFWRDTEMSSESVTPDVSSKMEKVFGIGSLEEIEEVPIGQMFRIGTTYYIRDDSDVGYSVFGKEYTNVPEVATTEYLGSYVVDTEDPSFQSLTLNRLFKCEISEVVHLYIKISDNDYFELSGLATIAYVDSQGFLTEHQDISGKMNLAPVSSANLSDDTQLKPGQFYCYNEGVVFKDKALGAAGHKTLEDTSHKVTSISSSPSDSKYPSEKAVKNYVDSVIGGIENGSY